MAIDVLTLGAAIGAAKKNSGGGSGVTNGYYYNGAFYKDAQHTTLITPEEGKLYYDLDNGVLYMYNGTDYTPLADNIKVFDAETALYDDVYDATVNRGMLVFVLYKYATSFNYKTALIAKYATGLYGENPWIFLVSPENCITFQRGVRYNSKQLYISQSTASVYNVSKDSSTGKIVLTEQSIYDALKGQPTWTSVTAFTEFIDSYNYTSSDGGVKVPHMLLAKAMNDRIDALQNLGRYLALWNASTGVPTSEPLTSPYAYKSGDYFRVGTAGNRVPTGNSYTIGGTNYETVTETINVGDVYYYDGTVWKRQPSSGEVSWGEIQGDITDQSDLASYLAAVLTALQGVQLNGTDLTPDANKKVNIQSATDSAYGVVKGNSQNGVRMASGGIPTIVKATDAEVAAKTNQYHAIVPANLQTAVDVGVKGSANYIPFGYMTASGETGTINFYTEITPNAT